jgi:hypothetical protein
MTFGRRSNASDCSIGSLGPLAERAPPHPAIFSPVAESRLEIRPPDRLDSPTVDQNSARLFIDNSDRTRLAMRQGRLPCSRTKGSPPGKNGGCGKLVTLLPKNERLQKTTGQQNCSVARFVFQPVSAAISATPPCQTAGLCPVARVPGDGRTARPVPSGQESCRRTEKRQTPR